MCAVADLFGAGSALGKFGDLLERMAPGEDCDLDANRAGVYWIGVSFPPGQAPALTIYINARWGGREAQWERIFAFAQWFGLAGQWRALEQQLRSRMDPLGTAIMVSAGKPPAGRVYASAWGLPLDYYRSLLAAFREDEISHFAREVLGEKGAYPIPSAACSFELSAAAKFELCGHCVFASDAEAVERCSSWLQSRRCNATLYLDTINILTRGWTRIRAKPPEVHSCLGIGTRGWHPYSTLYLNPGPPLRGD